MGTSIKLALLYFGCQILGAFLAMFGGVFYLMLNSQPISLPALQDISLAPALLLGILLMTLYLWKEGYISREKVTWSPVSGVYLLYSVIFYAGFLLLVEFIISLLPPLPNFLEQSFERLQSNWIGLLCITILGPVLEELLFRGAITKVLLKEYNPTKAIFLSAFIFGVIHINPAQVLSAGLIGLILAWIYYKTASLLPCILLHILNNSLSVYLNFKYPEMEYLTEKLSSMEYAITLAIAAIVCIGIYFLMNKVQVTYPWRKEQA